MRKMKWRKVKWQIMGCHTYKEAGIWGWACQSGSYECLSLGLFSQVPFKSFLTLHLSCSRHHSQSDLNYYPILQDVWPASWAPNSWALANSLCMWVPSIWAAKQWLSLPHPPTNSALASLKLFSQPDSPRSQMNGATRMPCIVIPSSAPTTTLELAKEKVAPVCDLQKYNSCPHCLTLLNNVQALSRPGISLGNLRVYWSSLSDFPAIE